MRVFIGLAALAAVNAEVFQTNVAVSLNQFGVLPLFPPVGSTAKVLATVQQQSFGGVAATVSPAFAADSSGYLASNNFAITVPYAVSALAFNFQTNQYTGQLQYRWYPWAPNYQTPDVAYPNQGLSKVSYTCDICAGSTPISCNSATGPGASPSPTLGYQCSNLSRNYLFSGLATSVTNSFSVQVFDINTNPAPNASSYSFVIVRLLPPVIVGDPQIVGMQGQDFQVHGIPDEIFNMVSSQDVQVNARFTYLESAACHDNYTACFAHPGTYITEEGFRVATDKVRLTAGSFKKGLTVHVNGKKVTKTTDLKQGSVEIVNHRRAIVHTSLMTITVTNSDKFMNQEMTLNKPELLALGSKRRVLADNERFHSEVPVHGLQGQTWRNVEYPSGLEYEGSITDYHVVSGNIYGTDFTFNQFQESEEVDQQ